jgi:hypothetical protein
VCDGDEEFARTQLRAACDLACWTEDLDIDVWKSLHDSLEYGADIHDIQQILVDALPNAFEEWQQLGRPQTREEWHEKLHYRFRHPVAVIGVIHQNNIDMDWLNDEINRGINITCLECDCRIDGEVCEECQTEHFEFLIGAWYMVDGKYQPDCENKNEEFAASYFEEDGYIIVHWSVHTSKCLFCSPCFYGCGDLDSPGNEVTAFSLPPDAFTCS